MAIAFRAAAHAAEISEDEDVVDVPIEGVVYKARRPTPMQGALLNEALTSTNGAERLSAVFRLIQALLGSEAKEVLEEMAWDRRIDFPDLIGGSEQNPDGGLLDQIFAEFAARPTEPSTDSSSSQTSGGRKSTGRSPGRGSTRSASPSTPS